MEQNFKPVGYNSLSPYIIASDAQQLIDLLEKIFDAQTTRRFDLSNGKIMHAEIRIDDSILMLSDATEQYPPNESVLHVYVADVDKVFRKAIAGGCTVVAEPAQKEGDVDRRGTFKDFTGNMWSVSTQQ